MLNKLEFKQIFDLYFDSIRSYAFYRCGNAELASDIAQDVFMKVWEKRDKFENSNIKSLLYKMANDMVISAYRKDKKLSHFEESMLVIDNFDDSPDDVLQFEELKKSYSKSLNRMSENQRTTFLMSRNEGMKYAEIADCLNISVKAESEKKLSITQKYYTLSGIVTDAKTGEQLPYAYLTTPHGIITCDEKGYFAIKSTDTTPVQIQIQQLGFRAKDTIISVGFNSLNLLPNFVNLSEIVVSPSPSTMLIQSGKTSGELRINHQIARYIPGSVDNSVFNLMRMMPGIRASGEPSDDLIVWGSNIGESQITYDGFTIFGIKNYNDHIGSVNPYLVKDIRLLKAGYDSSQGGKIGAMAEITGNDGNFNLPTVKASLSNYAANMYASMPITKRMNIAVAYRQTYYNLYNSENINVAEDNSQILTDIYIKPKYEFRDLNMKLSGKVSSNDSYYISVLGADDRFKFSVKQQGVYDVNAAEKNRQYGGAASYKRIWENGSSTRFLATFSRLTSLLDNLMILDANVTKPNPIDVSHLDNIVQEFSLKLHHYFHIGSKNRVKIGGEWQQYRVSLNDECGELGKPTFFVTDNLTFSRLSIEAGVRIDFPLKSKLLIQPRISARHTISNEFTATASWGLYKQFLSRVSHQYDDVAYQTVWSMTDSTQMKAMHTVAGIAYSKDDFLVSIEGYCKTTKNGRYFLDNQVYKLNNIIWGADLYAKKEINKHTLYGSYSISNLRRPQSELSHEIKVGGIGAFDPFYLSFNYVYGKGFSYISTGGHGHGQESEEEQHPTTHEHSDSTSEPYNRFDIGATYKKQFRQWRLQTGISLLNVFGTKNVKYNYQLSDQNNATNVFTKATPFTPTIFVEIVF